jgi:hypothetical protein
MGPMADRPDALLARKHRGAVIQHAPARFTAVRDETTLAPGKEEYVPS